MPTLVVEAQTFERLDAREHANTFDEQEYTYEHACKEPNTQLANALDSTHACETSTC